MSEIKNEALEKATQEYVQAAYYRSREETFKAGAEWQKEQDKDKVYTLKDMEAAFEAGKTYGDSKELKETPNFHQFYKP